MDQLDCYLNEHISLSALPFTAMSVNDALAAVKTLYDVANKVNYFYLLLTSYFSHKY